jgi:CHAT domain-containing protein/tetratricopeptide (TPR) repeat protein
VLFSFTRASIVLAQENPSDVLLNVEGSLELGDLVLEEDQSLYDRHTFEGKAGQRIGITLESVEFDPYLIVRLPNDKKLDKNDDYDESNRSAGLIVTLPVDGSYTIIANGYNAQSRGRYRLNVTLLSDGQQELTFSATTQRQVEAYQINQQGLQQLNTSQYSTALRSFQQALKIYLEIGDREGEGTSLNNIGHVYSNQGQYRQALEHYQQALVIQEEIGDRSGEGVTLSNIGSIYYRLGQYRQALDYYQQSLFIQEEIGDRRGEGTTLNNIGSIYDSQGQYPQALDYYQQSLVIAKEIGTRQGEGDSLNNIGSIYDSQGKYPQALDYHQQALIIRKEIGDRSGEGESLNNIGGIYASQGQYPQALDYYQQALIIKKEIGDRRGKGIILNNIGFVYSSQGQYSQAIDHYQQALVIFKEIGDRSGEGAALNNIGGIYDYLGQYQQALDYYQQSVIIRKEIGDRSGEGESLNNIGRIYDRLGQYPQALDYYQQALIIKKEIGDRSSEGTILNNIGGTYDHLGQYQQALDYYQQSLIITKEIGNREGEGTTLNNIGKIYDRLEQYPQALDYYQRALIIQKEIGDREGEGITLNNIGFTYDNLGQYRQALDYYQQSLVIKKEIGDRSGEGTTLNNIGYLLAAQAQTELAIVFYKQSVNTYEAIRGSNQGLSQELQQSYTETVADPYRSLAALLLKNDRVLEAQQVLDLLKVEELDDYLRGVRGTGQQLAILRPEQEILAQYNELQQSAIALGTELSHLQQRLSRGETLSTAELDRIDRLIQLQKDLNQQFNQFASSPDILALLDQLSPSVLRQSVALEDLTSLQDDLKPLNAALLYPLILDDRLELVLTTPNAPPLRRTIPVPKAELNQAILAFRQALQDPTQDATQPAQKLYNWLIKPIEADLAQANIQTIIYAPDGQLRYIPLAALYDPTAKQWLIQRYRINHITAKSLTKLDRQPTAQPRIFAGAFADPGIEYTIPVGDRTQSFRGLPFAGQEVKNLSNMFPNTNPLIDRNFTLTDTQRSMNASNIVHFATHASFVTGVPENSFILFGNGERSTLTDIGSWSLQNVDLVVLSACETGLGGLGNGEEILGLGYQFHNRGARAVMASLWAVSDGGTQALMTSFYAALQHQDSKAEALQKAQIALITGNYETLEDSSRGIVGVRQRVETGTPANVVDRLSHPYYWAPFILIGNGL